MEYNSNKMGALNINAGKVAAAPQPAEQLAAPSASQPMSAIDHSRRNPLLVLWQRRWILVTCMLLSLAAAVVWLWTRVPLYLGSAQVLVEQNAPRIVPNDPTSGVMAGGQNFLWTQCGLIQSRAILEPVCNDASIRARPSFDDAHSTQDVLNRLRGMTEAVVGRRDDIITINVKSEYPDDAAAIANAIVVSFTKYHEASKRSVARQLLEVFQNRMQQIDTDLAKKRQAMLDFKTKNASFAFGNDRVDPTLDRLNKLSAALTDLQLNTLNAQAAFETAKSMMSDPVKMRQLLESRPLKSETAQLRAEMREAQQRLVGISKNYLPNFPEFNAIQESIKQLNDEMAAEDKRIVDAYVAELEANVQSAKFQEQQIQTMLNDQRREVLARNQVAAQYSDLQSEQERLEGERRDIFQGIRGLDMTKDVGAMNVTSVESAVPSGAPFYPSRSFALVCAMVIGTVAGGLLAFLRDFTDQRLRSAEEIKQVLGLPVLGIVPHMAGVRSPTERGMHLHSEPMSDVAESYRTVRTAVYFGQSGAVARTLLVTSPAPGDGKTTLASNLAIAMAQAGNRILLLDADFRKPAQHKIFAIEKRSGLSSVLAGEAKLEEVIHPTSIPGLDLLPCGPIPANPSEILNSQTFADLLEELTRRYDHVLLDSPPVMPVTDARILAASCDATVMALRAEKTTRKGAIYARDMLHSVGSQILGVVVNDVPRRKGIYGYYYSETELYMYGYGRRGGGGSPGSSSSNGTGKEKANGAAALPAPATKAQA